MTVLIGDVIENRSEEYVVLRVPEKDEDTYMVVLARIGIEGHRLPAKDIEIVQAFEWEIERGSFCPLKA